MSSSDESSLELRRIRRMLKQMYSLAQDSSLTGMLSDGAGDAVEHYNRILVRLREMNVVSEALFPPLPTGASFDRLGVASKLLEGYLTDEPIDSRGGVVIGNITGLDDLKEIGRQIRVHLPDVFRKYVPQTGDAHREEDPPPPPPGSEPPPAPPAPPDGSI